MYVQGCITVCCEEQSIEPTLQYLQTDTTGKIYATFGMHPHEAKSYTDAIEQRLIGLMSYSKAVVAWGEIGLDYYYKHSDIEIQKKVFIRQLKHAVVCKKPLVIHSRDAEQDTIDILSAHVPKDWRIHLHCFTSSLSMAQTLLKLYPNMCIGFTGVITFKDSGTNRQTVAEIPVDRLLLETDGPYMAPLPHRGELAHPGHIPVTAQTMAQIKNMPLEQFLAQIRKNVNKVYGI